MTKYKNQQSGYLILFGILFLAIMMTLSASLLTYTWVNLRGVRQSYGKTQVLYLAQAGVDKAISELNTNASYTGESNTTIGPGAFTISVSSINSNTKQITATGYVSNSTNPSYTRTVKANVSIDTTSVAFNFGVQLGVGGLLMENNSTINGNVISNGNITGGNADITGGAIIAAGTAATTDEQWTVQNQDFVFGDASARRDVAQSFRPTVTATLNKIQFYIKKVGNPGDLTARIVADNSGDPRNTSLANTTMSASMVTTSYGWVEVSFSSPTTLTSGTTYWIMLSTASVSSSNYYIWGRDQNNGYGNGVAKYSNNWSTGSPSWTDIVGDLNYKTFMGGVTTYFDGDIDVGANLTATEIRNCGTVTGAAYYGSVFTSCSAGSSVASSTIPGPSSMPISSANLDDWKAAATAGGTISGNYTINSLTTIGPKVIDGNLTVTGGAIVYITGPIWVKGDILLDNNVTIRIDTSLGNSGTMIIADNLSNPSTSGIITASNNVAIEGNGNPNSFPMLISLSTNSTAAISISNNAVAAIYYAPNGTITVSNNAGGNQITGNLVHLYNNATINYVSGLAEASFSSGPGGAWTLVAGTYIIVP